MPQKETVAATAESATITKAPSIYDDDDDDDDGGGGGVTTQWKGNGIGALPARSSRFSSILSHLLILPLPPF